MTSKELIRGIFAHQRRRATLGALGMAGHQTCEALVPVAFGLVIDRAVRTSDISAMIISAVGVLALFTVLTFAARAGIWLVARAVFEEAHYLRVRMVANLLRRRPRAGDRQTGEQLSIVTSDALAAAEVLEIIGWMAGATVGLTLTAVLLIRIDWVLGIGILIGVPLLMLGLSRLGPRLERRTANQQQTVGLAAGLAADLVSGMRPLRGFGGVPEAIRRYRRVSRTSRDAHVSAVTATAQFAGIAAFSTGALLAIVGGVAGWLALVGRLSIGELVTVVGLAAFISDPISSISRLITHLAISRASAARVAELLAEDPTGTGQAESLDDAEVEFAGVRAPGLTDLSLRAAPAEIVGVVASTATSAASLTGLLDGSRTPDAGAVLLGGQPLRDLAAERLPEHLLVEPHAVHLFGSTLREALQIGPARPDADLEHAMAAASLADLTGDGRPDLDHPLDDHGLNLSGGQRQRVAMARALLADRSVLVLRDPTTAIDAVTENAMVQGIRRYRRRPGRSTIMITTSPPLLAGCDRVIFLDADGRPRTGSHHELSADPEYAAVVLR